MNNNFPIVLVHQNSKYPVGVIANDGTELFLKSKTCPQALWELASRFPENWIGWCEKDLQNSINLQQWNEIFHHNLIMASYAVKTIFLQESIGYVDQLPFVSVNRNVQYGTWQMSSDIGGIKGEVLLKFQPFLSEIKDFDYLLNSIAKIGQQNSLFCYSSPALYKKESGSPERIKNIALSPKPVGSTEALFAFTSQHYRSGWTSILLLHFFLYEKSFPFISFLRSFAKKNLFQKAVDLSTIPVESRKEKSFNDTIDVIIPTVGRKEYLYDVLQDFSAQTHLPEKVIIVEQNPREDSWSELDYITEEQWPFEIEHHFINKTGACNARNQALSSTTADWVFFSDDDQRFGPDLIEKVFREIKRLGVEELTTSYLQKGESNPFLLPKQWGTFGAGNSIVYRKKMQGVKFSSALENGYGEDVDFGMQLRNQGVDIIYNPTLEIQHLKAPSGGFRHEQKLPWDNDSLSPKPSPTLMVLIQKYFTPHQIRGFRTSLFLRYYKLQSIKNPFTYLRMMKKRWNNSEYWASELMRREG